MRGKEGNLLKKVFPPSPAPPSSFPKLFVGKDGWERVDRGRRCCRPCGKHEVAARLRIADVAGGEACTTGISAFSLKGASVSSFVATVVRRNGQASARSAGPKEPQTPREKSDHGTKFPCSMRLPAFLAHSCGVFFSGFPDLPPRRSRKAESWGPGESILPGGAQGGAPPALTRLLPLSCLSDKRP